MISIQTQNKKRAISDPLTYRIIGAGMEVHKRMGCGFMEAVYQEALERELVERQIEYKREVELPIYYRNVQLNTFYKADFICFNSIVVELKAIKQIGAIEEAQIINYLKATQYDVGLLMNFGNVSLTYKRYIFQNLRNPRNLRIKTRLEPQITDDGK